MFVIVQVFITSTRSDLKQVSSFVSLTEVVFLFPQLFRIIIVCWKIDLFVKMCVFVCVRARFLLLSLHITYRICMMNEGNCLLVHILNSFLQVYHRGKKEVQPEIDFCCRTNQVYLNKTFSLSLMEIYLDISYVLFCLLSAC